MKFIIFLILFTISSVMSSSEIWNCEKKTSFYSAFTKGSGVKSYRIRADLDVCAETACDFLLAFEEFPNIYDGIESIRMLKSSDSSFVHYTVMDSPWPFSDRDMVTQIKISNTPHEIRLYSFVPEDISVKEDRNKIRIKKFEENIILEKKGPEKCRMICEGTIDIGGGLPEWLKNKILLKGPVETVEMIQKLKRTDK